jgi:hypothetical protein
MTIERRRSAGSCPNAMVFESSGMRSGSAGLRAAGAAALMALAAAALAFNTAAQAQQQKKPAPPAARAAPAPHAVVRTPSPPPQRTVTRPPSPPPPQQRIVTRPPSPPPQRTAIPNRPLTPTQPPQRPQRTVIPNGPVGTPRPGQNAIPQGPRGREPAQAGLSPTGLKFGPRGTIATPARLPQGPNALRQPGFPAVTVNNRSFPIVRSERFIHMGGRNRFFVPLAALGAVLIGGSYWNPDGYVSIPAPFCAGFTPEGCQLHWREVDFVDGGGEPQCVQYCPLAALPPPPPLPAQGTCQLTVYSDANFAGTSAPTGDNQPNLSESGWQNEISSIQVQAGTWDFFTDDDYGGNTMRLTAGDYPMLTPDWDKKTNSFMCVAPDPGA